MRPSPLPLPGTSTGNHQLGRHAEARKLPFFGSMIIERGGDPLALALRLLGRGAFLWTLKSGQYDDLDGAGWRAIGFAAGSYTPTSFSDR